MNREEKNALSRQRILEAALEEFSQKGYEAASLSNVCAEKGISKGIIYHHFKDKDALSNSTRAFIDHTRRWVLANFPDGWNAPPPTTR